MNSISKLILFMGFLLLNISCTSGKNMILEYEDVQFFNAKVDRSNERIFHIEGLVFHSALSVEKIKTFKEGNTLNVQIFLARARKDLSGSFNYSIPLDTNITKVTFGKKKYVVWTK